MPKKSKLLEVLTTSAKVLVPAETDLTATYDKPRATPQPERSSMRDEIDKVDRELGYSGSKQTAPAFPIDILFLDCFPLSGLDAELVSAHSLIHQASASVASDNGVISARIIDYGKGMDQLAVQLAHDIRASPVKYLYLETKSSEGRACMQPLMGLARMVVKGAF